MIHCSMFKRPQFGFRASTTPQNTTVCKSECKHGSANSDKLQVATRAKEELLGYIVIYLKNGTLGEKKFMFFFRILLLCLLK